MRRNGTRAAAAIAGLSIPLDAGIVAALALSYAARRDRRLWVRTPLDAPLAALVLLSLVASPFARSPLASLAAAAGLAVAAYFAYQVPYRLLNQDPEMTGVLYRWACAALPLAAALGLASYLWVSHPELGEFRRFSMGQAPVGIYAYGLEIGLLLALGAVERLRWVAAIAIGAGVFGLICTLSRWAILGVAAGLVTWSLLTARHRPRAVACALTTVVLAAVVTLSLPLTRSIVRQYLPEHSGRGLWAQAIVTGLTPGTGFPERLVVWKNTLRVIRDHAYVGVGLSAFPATYREYLEPSDRSVEVPEIPVHLSPAHAHNEVLSVAAGAGLPAAVAYVSLLAASLMTAFRNVSPRTAPALAALVAAVAHGLFDAISTVSIGPLAVFFVVLAAAVQPAAAPAAPTE